MNNTLCFAVLAASLACTFGEADTLLFSENFEGVTLGSPVDEGNTVGFDGTIGDYSNNAFTHTGPAGWGRSFTPSPGTSDGVQEWAGWSFANADFWEETDGQDRDEFNASGTGFASGVIAVADSDEWNDKGDPIDSGVLYNTLMETPLFSLQDQNQLTISFASSWRNDGAFSDGPNENNNQTATLEISYNGVDYTEVLRWETADGVYFKDDAANELVTIEDINVDNGATQAQLRFGLLDAGDDWWWGVDNISVTGVVPEPATVLMLVLGGGLVGLYRRLFSK